MKTRAKVRLNRKGLENKESQMQEDKKKPFDKKKYRLQKYSNKYKINQWEERRKKAILRNFYKELGTDKQKILKKPFASKSDNQNENKKQTKKINPFQKAKQEYLRKKAEKRKEGKSFKSKAGKKGST